jgi:hypothetical protein
MMKIIEEQKLKERLYDLIPEHDSRGSFYGKAKVEVKGNDVTLYSYNTPIVKYNLSDRKVVRLCDGDVVSATTMRHLREFIQQAVEDDAIDSVNQINKAWFMSLPKETIDESLKEDLDYEDGNWFKFSVGDTAYLGLFNWDNGRKSYYEKVIITKRWNGEVSGVQGNYYSLKETSGNEITSCPEQFLLSRYEVEKRANSNGDKFEESINEDLENLETEEDAVAMPQPMAVAKEESEDLWKKFLEATEEPKDAPLFGAEDQPVPDEVEEPKAELEESLSLKLTLDEGLFDNKKTLKEGIKEEKTALRELQKQLRRLSIELKDCKDSIRVYVKGNENYTNLIDDLYEARNGLLGAIDDIDNLIFEDHQLSSRRNESFKKLKEGYSVVDLETGDRFGNYDDIEEAKSKAYRYATMFKAECAVINDRMRPVCGFRSNGREISLKGLGESFKKLKEANGADGQLFNGQKDIADSFKNYKAFKANFKPVHIVKVNGNYFVFNEDAQDSNSYIYYSNSKDNIEGWLYGAVQAKNKRIAEGLKKNKKSVKENFYLKTKNPKKKLNEAYITKDFDEFEPWSGAVEVWEKILDEDKLDDLERFVDEVYNGVIGETELNDLLRFDSDYVYDVLGMSAEEDVDESLSKKKLKESFSQSELATWLEDSVNWLVENQEGCATYKLDNRLAVCVGWEDFGDGWETVVGIKVWTSDDMRTDYDWINAPYYENGDVIDTTTSISQNDNFNELAKWLLSEYTSLASLKIERDGKIIEGEEDVDESLRGSKKRNLKEEVSDYAYELAAEIDKRFRDEGFISWEDFNEVYEDWFEYDKANLDDDQDLWELETDVRGILSMMGWETIYEGEDEGSLKLLESKKRADKKNLKEASTLPKGGKDEDFDTDAWSVIYWELSANSEDSASTRNMKKLAKTSAKASDKYERVDPVNDSDLRVYAKDEDGFKLAKKVADAWKVKYEIEPTKKSHQAKFPDERLQMTIFIPEEMLG